MMASPMYLSTVPSSPRMMSVIGDRYSLRKVDSSTAVKPSDRVVNDADVAKHQGELALLAAELQLLRVFGQPRDHRGRHVATEGRADLAHLLPLLAVELPDAGEEHEAGGDARA